MTAPDNFNDVAAWQNVATDKTTAYQHPITIQGIHPVTQNIMIRLLISREDAARFMEAPQLDGLDVLILSATCWDMDTGQQVPHDHTLFMAHIDQLLSTEHAQYSVEHRQHSVSDAKYRIIFIDSSNDPVRAVNPST